MADWRKLAKQILLADGQIDVREVGVVRRELFADGKIDEHELEFLWELKREAKAVAPAFTQLVFMALKNNIMADGIISPNEVVWLRRWLLADGKIDADEKKFLQELKSGAKQVCKEFETFYGECMKS